MLDRGGRHTWQIELSTNAPLGAWCAGHVAAVRATSDIAMILVRTENGRRPNPWGDADAYKHLFIHHPRGRKRQRKCRVKPSMRETIDPVEVGDTIDLYLDPLDLQLQGSRLGKAASLSDREPHTDFKVYGPDYYLPSTANNQAKARTPAILPEPPRKKVQAIMKELQAIGPSPKTAWLRGKGVKFKNLSEFSSREARQVSTRDGLQQLAREAARASRPHKGRPPSLPTPPTSSAPHRAARPVGRLAGLPLFQTEQELRKQHLGRGDSRNDYKAARKYVAEFELQVKRSTIPGAELGLFAGPPGMKEGDWLPFMVPPGGLLPSPLPQRTYPLYAMPVPNPGLAGDIGWCAQPPHPAACTPPTPRLCSRLILWLCTQARLPRCCDGGSTRTGWWQPRPARDVGQ